MTYEYFGNLKHIADEAESLSEIASTLEANAKVLRDMEAAGLQIDPNEGEPVDGGKFFVFTEDKEIATRFGFDLQEEDDTDTDQDGEA
jgi:hypothetical protein